MFEMLEKAMLAGLGAVAMSQKKAEELVAECKEKYRTSEEEGKVFLDRVQVLAKEGRQRFQDIAEEEVRQAIHRLGGVTREEYDLLLARVQDLENRMKEQ
jgi:polyhydroxyalkanoate synthesis regulator phasin